MFVPQFRTHSVTLDVELAPDLPNLLANPDQLKAVLQSTLDNTVQYGQCWDDPTAGSPGVPGRALARTGRRATVGA